MRRGFLVSVSLLFAGCGNDYYVQGALPEPPPRPPPAEEDPQGEPPDFQRCTTAHFAWYYNLSDADPNVGFADPNARVPGTDPIDPAAVPYWDHDHIAFSRYDASLEFGPNWWPVDEGIAGDPQGFAVDWYSWIYVREDVPVQMVLGAGNDVFVTINDEVRIARTDVRYAPEAVTLDVGTGVKPVHIRYAQRKDDEGGFRFRVTNRPEEVQLCPPEFPEPEAE